ncbi:tyrosine-type recombinase/integrase [Mycolicibacterium komossense]|uniref:tyrosine-type recombinase/integrase n=1 Tax=Mycolicibacterium komossense TaxID=1779 RepID=UPI0021F32E9C
MPEKKATGPRPRPTPHHWKPLLDGYLTELAAAGYPVTTRNTRAAHVRRIAAGVGVSPQELAGDSLVRFFAAQQHWAQETRRGYRNTAVSFFGWAHKAGLLDANPADSLPAIKASPPAPRPAPDRVYRGALIAADPRVMLMLRLAAELGMRRAEVAQVATTDLIEGFDGYQLVVHGKGGKLRTLPCSDELGDAIALGAAGHTPGAKTTGYLFPNGGGGNFRNGCAKFGDGHLAPKTVGVLVSRAMAAEGWTMHKLRHRFATLAYRGSRNMPAVQQLLGHASLATSQLYIAVDDTEVRAAMMAASDAPPARLRGLERLA